MKTFLLLFWVVVCFCFLRSPVYSQGNGNKDARTQTPKGKNVHPIVVLDSIDNPVPSNHFMKKKKQVTLTPADIDNDTTTALSGNMILIDKKKSPK